MMVPAGTPPAVIQRISAVLLSALKSSEVREPLMKQGALLVGGSPGEFPAYYAQESTKWGEIIRSRGITMK
jgi:tripartite-type tricarboxylate transporter receptor subunit TctC